MSIKYLPNLAWRSAVQYSVAAFFTATLFLLPVNASQVLCVSKLGDNSDGSSWVKAFRSVQAALNAVPDAKGGHRIIVRPDTYIEANLFATQRGAAGAYNQLIGDTDGSLGSGATGWVILDSGVAEKGFKSYYLWDDAAGA